MRNLGKTIDKILAVDPCLGPHLTPIKNKWEKYPKKEFLYWKQIISILNTNLIPGHPNRDAIKEILNPPRKKIPAVHSFEVPTKMEQVLGVIPEGIECRIRKYDRKNIELAKKEIEAKLTHNISMFIAVSRDIEILDNLQKKVWIDLKDHFKIWGIEGAYTFLIRKKDNVLVLTSIEAPHFMPFPEHGPGPGQGSPESHIMRLDPETLRKLFRYLNINPPPGFFPE